MAGLFTIRHPEEAIRLGVVFYLAGGAMGIPLALLPDASGDLDVYLVVRQHLPYERAAELLADVLGAPVSTGALAQMVAEASEALGPFLDAVRAGLLGAPVAHFDETGARVGGKLAWVHSASTDALTLYLAHERRGVEAMDEMGVLAHFSGIACHDGWKPYGAYGTVTHALCNAHHLRELDYVANRMGQSWAGDMADLLLEIKRATERARERGAEHLHPCLLGRYTARYDRIVASGWSANPAPTTRTRRRGPIARSKAANLLARLDRQHDAVLRFATDLAVPFDNNLSERDVRMVKLQNKVSGCWRTMAGAERFCRIRSYLSTARKQGEGMLDVLGQLFAGRAWMPALPGPP